MSDALLVRLQAVAALADADANAETHTTALKAELQVCMDASGCDWVNLSSTIGASALPKDMKATLLTFIADGMKQRTQRRRPMQDYSAIWYLLPSPVWEKLKQQKTPNACLAEVCLLLSSFGCRCPNERTKASVARILGEQFQADACSMVKVVCKEWKKVARKSVDPAEWVETLPNTVELLKKAYPKLFQTIPCYQKHGESAADPNDFVDISNIDMGASLMPLRSKANAAAPSKPIVLHEPGMGQIGMGDMMQFAKGLTDMLAKQHMSLVSQMQSMHRGSSRELTDDDVNPLPPRSLKRKAPLCLQDKSEEPKQEVATDGDAETEAQAEGGFHRDSKEPRREGDEADGAGKTCVDAAGDLLFALNARKAAAAAKKAAAAAGAASSGGDAAAGGATASPKGAPKGKAKAAAKAVAKGKAKAAAKPKGRPRKDAAAAGAGGKEGGCRRGGYASANEKRQTVEARRGSGQGSSKCFPWAQYGGKMKAMAAAYAWLSE